MSYAGNVLTGVDRIMESGIRVVEFGADLANRYNRLSRLLESLHEGSAEEYLRTLSVNYIGPQVNVDLITYDERKDYYPYPDQDAETSTRTLIRANWGDDGQSKLYVVAYQTRREEGEVVETSNYQCNNPAYYNKLPLGRVIRAARVAKGMQKRQRK